MKIEIEIPLEEQNAWDGMWADSLQKALQQITNEYLENQEVKSKSIKAIVDLEIDTFLKEIGIREF